MNSYLLIHPEEESRKVKAREFLEQNGIFKNHPNLLWLEEEKLGVEEAKKIRTHLFLKPYQKGPQTAVIIKAQNLTQEAQNSLLKILEEPPLYSLIILTAPTTDNLLPTIVSRCQIIHLPNLNQNSQISFNQFFPQIETLLKTDYSGRFQFIEKLKDRESFFSSLIFFFREKLTEQRAFNNLISSGFFDDLLETQKWQQQNVNIRAILEYLMLRMPKEV